MKNHKRFSFHIWLLASILLPGLAVAQGIEIESGASIIVTGAASIEITDGDFIVTGSYTSDLETLIMSGTTAGTIEGGAISLYDLNITNSAGITTNATEITTNDLSIGASGVFDISSSSAVSVGGDLSNSGSTNSLIVASDNASGSESTGSLITSTDGQPLTVQRHMVANQWHIVSPSASEIILPTFMSAPANAIPTNGANYAMTNYDESTNRWNAYFTTSTTGTMTPGEAYLLRRTTAAATEFAGNSKGTTTSVTLSKDGYGWNAVGNPFSSAIKVQGDIPGTDNFLGVNASSLDPLFAALYIFDPTSPDQYKIINNTPSGGRFISQDYVQVGQGFMVRAKEDNSTISFTPAMKFHQGTTNFYKKSQQNEEWIRVEVVITAGEKETSTLLLFNENMTPGLDLTYDAGLLGGDSNFKTYTLLAEDYSGGTNIAIQCLPTFAEQELTIPLGLEYTDGGAINISIESESLPGDIRIVLEDKQSQEFTDLQPQQSGYASSVPPLSSGADRFNLNISYSDNSTGIETTESDRILLYSKGKMLFIEGTTRESARLDLFDVSGRIAGSYMPEPFTRNVFDLNHLVSGIYFVQVRSNEGVVTKQVFLGD